MNDVLITGANGFIGRRLAGRLASTPGTTVTAAVRREHLFPPRVRVLRVDDIGPGTAWTPALGGCGVVIHLAARVHVMRDEEPDPLAAFRRINVDGTLALARQAAHAGVGRFVYLSSIKVNGEATGPGECFRESDPPGPRDAYGRSKAEAEAGLQQIARETGMDVVVIRPPLVYGPGVKANFRTMASWIARGLPLPLGSIRQNRRTLVGLDNLIDLIVTCASHPAAANEVFLAGDAEDLSTTELLRRTAAALGVRPRLLPVPERALRLAAGAVGRSGIADRLCGNLRVDTTKARELLGWSPPCTVDEELRRAVADLRTAGGRR